MSRRPRFLSIKAWEVDGLRRLSEHLMDETDQFCRMLFYYSFQIPRIGKEFDLLRISKDYVMNIELKSGNVSEETIKRQLKQNQYYLLSLGKSVKSYTYVSEEDRLYRLSKGENLVETSFQKLAEDLLKMQDFYEADIEELFNESEFLISPLTDADKFLNGEYFLTFQQRDIKHHILQGIKDGKGMLQGFTGLPGTGKTLLLYDIAMQLTQKQRVAVLHFGFFPEELERLNERLKRIDFYACRGMVKLPALEGYACILVDEGHQMPEELLEELLILADQQKLPVLFTYDQEDAIAQEETIFSVAQRLKKKNTYQEYVLTNRIRMNKELSTFIHGLLSPAKYGNRKYYPSVDVVYAENEADLERFIEQYKDKGYKYIEDASDTSTKEYDRVVMVMDEAFYYDEEWRLRALEEEKYRVRNLFHGLSRARSHIGIIVYKNEDVLREILEILQ
ncbi:MAG: ATP-binding protein [Lachnospiraceae bacterium]|nr:ATP-binding protein [Lachnospiraceae bacterium]